MKSVKLLIFTVLLFGFSAHAADFFSVRGDIVKAGSGGGFEAHISVSVPSEYFVYADEVTVDFKSLEGIHIKDIIFPEPKLWFDSHVGRNKLIFDDDFQILITGEVPEGATLGEHNLMAAVTLQGCNAKTCLYPETHDAEIEVEVVPAKEGEFGRVRKEITRVIPFDVFALFVVGLLAAFTPCVWPLIPVVLLIAGAAGRVDIKRRLSRLILLLAGLLISFGIIGYAASALGKEIDFVFRYKWFVVSMAVMFVVMALVVADVIRAPVLRSEVFFLKRGGAFWSFVAGIGIGFMASPCTAPILVAVASYAVWQANVVRGVILFMSYGAGFAVSFVAVAFFMSEIKKRLPRSALVWSRRILAVILLIPAAYLIHSIVSQGRPPKDINWVDAPSAVEVATKSERPIVIVVTAKWCPGCRALEEILQRKNVEDMIAEFVPVLLDITFHSKPVDAMMSKYEIAGAPAVIFLSPEGSLHDEFTLYSPGADELVAAMRGMLKIYNDNK